MNDPDSHEESQSDSRRSPDSKSGSSNLESSKSESNAGKPSKAEMPANAWMKFAGLGMELAASTLGLGAIGYLVDRFRGKADGYGVAAGLLVGFSFGMFRLIQKAMNEIRNQTK